MFTIVYCLVVELGLRNTVGITIRFSVWSVSCYAHVFVRL